MSENLTQQAYDYIIAKLCSRQLAPGSRLTNRGIATEIGTSFTPVREALNRLVSEGYLSHQPGTGVFVPHYSRQTVLDIYEEREMLETFAVRKICENHDNIDFSAITSFHKKMAEIRHQLDRTEDEDEWLKLSEKWRLMDSSFHLSILQAAGNRRIFHSASELQTLHKIVLHHPEKKKATIWGRTYQEHADLLEALLRGDADKSQAILRKHIRQGCQLALNTHDQHYMNVPADGLHGPHVFSPTSSTEPFEDRKNVGLHNHSKHTAPQYDE